MNTMAASRTNRADPISISSLFIQNSLLNVVPVNDSNAEEIGAWVIRESPETGAISIHDPYVGRSTPIGRKRDLRPIRRPGRRGVLWLSWVVSRTTFEPSAFIT